MKQYRVRLTWRTTLSTTYYEGTVKANDAEDALVVAISRKMTAPVINGEGPWKPACISIEPLDR